VLQTVTMYTLQASANDAEKRMVPKPKKKEETSSKKKEEAPGKPIAMVALDAFEACVNLVCAKGTKEQVAVVDHRKLSTESCSQEMLIGMKDRGARESTREYAAKSWAWLHLCQVHTTANMSCPRPFTLHHMLHIAVR
jgi:hypothetical protein